MQRSHHKLGSATPLVLGLIGLGGAGLLWLSSVTRPADTARLERSTPAGSVTRDEAPGPLGSVAVAREPVAPGAPACAPHADLEVDDDGLSAGNATERECLSSFLALARDQQGTLESRAEALLDGTGPAPEKVALLRALERTCSSESLRWTEYAARTQPDDSGPQGVSVASFALDELARRAERDPAARSALLRLAFEPGDQAIELRRRAAAVLARVSDGSELGLLTPALLRQPDELLIQGVLAALQERPGVPQAERILATFSVPLAPPRTSEVE
jgi:hypothetical protein